MHQRTSGWSPLIDQMYITYAEGMTEEKLKLKCITGGKHHRSSLTFHFECDEIDWTDSIFTILPSSVISNMVR